MKRTAVLRAAGLSVGLMIGASLVSVPACNQIAGIEAGIEAGTACNTVTDCQVAEPDCRTASCEAGFCVFEDAPDGKALTKQTAADCQQVLCDGYGGTRIEQA